MLTPVAAESSPIRLTTVSLDPHIGVRVYDSNVASENTVRQLRVVVEVDDFDRAVRFYRDALGLEELAAFEGDGDARVVILDAGRATLELANAAQVDMIDRIEVGERVSPHVRLAFEVGDTAEMTDRLVSDGASLISDPVVTPWRSSNSRLQGAAGLQLTLFTELETEVERTRREGFGANRDRYLES